MSSDLAVNREYRQWLTKIKETIQQSQIKAAIRVNVELLQPYWQLGAMQGFSRTNLAYMRQWYLFYRYQDTIVPQVVGQLDMPAHEKIFQIPWGHNREIISKCQNLPEALYYVQQTIQHS